jgi:hypothetical protein
MNIKIHSMAIQGDNGQVVVTRQDDKIVFDYPIEDGASAIELVRVDITNQDALMNNARVAQQVVDGQFDAAATAEVGEALLSMTD